MLATINIKIKLLSNQNSYLLSRCNLDFNAKNRWLALFVKSLLALLLFSIKKAWWFRLIQLVSVISFADLALSKLFSQLVFFFLNIFHPLYSFFETFWLIFWIRHPRLEYRSRFISLLTRHTRLLPIIFLRLLPEQGRLDFRILLRD